MKKMPVNSLVVVSLAALLFLFLCVSMKERYREIKPEEAREKVSKGLYDYVVDVRTQEEWDEGHVEGTVSIPIGRFVTDLPIRIPDKTSRILFVCKKGIRASGVSTMAEKLGYSNVDSMLGNYREILLT